MIEGIFMGYHQQCGGGWSGDLLVLDRETVEQVDNLHELYVKRIKAEEVIPVYKDDKRTKFILPLAEGLATQPGQDRRKEARDQRRVAREEDAEEERERVAEEAAQEEALKAQIKEPRLSNQDDFWSLNGYALKRHHPNGRFKIFTFDEGEGANLLFP